MDVILTFCMTEWEVSIKYFGCILKGDDCVEEKPLYVFELQAELAAFFMNVIFTWRNNWQVN